MTLLLLMAQNCQIFSKNNQKEKAEKFGMVAHWTITLNLWAYTTRCLHKDENKRASAIEGPLRILLDRAFIATRASKVESDGVIVQPCGRSIAYLMIQELKNEIGEGSSDPYNQGSLAYQKYWSSGKLN